MSTTTLSGLRQKVFFDRYALKDKEGKRLEQIPEEMWRRVSRAIAENEKTRLLQQEWEEKFYEALSNFKFVPGGRILSGAGSGVPLTFYNCYVIPSPDDSRQGIFESVRTMVEIMSRGGGVGVNLSSIRPRGSRVKGVNGTASGAVSFGGLYSFATGLIIQGGSRRGALMLMLNDDHPDIEEFITAKKEMGKITNANLSICVSDRFMEAVKIDADWDLKWQTEVYKTIKARYLWDLICESAHTSGEPGVVFLERYNKESNTWYFENIISVNPCGEQGLPAWGVCNLGAINLAAFVEEGHSGKCWINKEKLASLVRTAIRFLDNVVDVTPYFFKENREAQMCVRRTGLGTMGLADALIKCGLRYGSEEAIKWCEEIYRLIRDEAYRASIELAKEKGSFPMFDREKYLQGRFIENFPEDIKKSIRIYGIRNGLLLTQAPTGTTSLLAGVSSGIEPVYDFAMKRKDRLGEHLVYHPLFEEWKKSHPQAKPGEKPDYFVTAKELTPREHVQMQAVIQKYTDSSISKTVNAPFEHMVDDVKALYEEAYALGCKGVTYYRDGSRDASVLESLEKKPEKKSESERQNSVVPQPRQRPEVMPGVTYKIKTGYGTMFVTINHDGEGKPFEVFATIGKAGGFFAAKSEAICRLISLALRSGITPATVIDQLKGIRGPMPSWSKNGQILSIPDAIAQVLTVHMNGNLEQMSFVFNKLNGHNAAAQTQINLHQKLLEETQLQQAAEQFTPKKIDQQEVKVEAAVTSTPSIADLGLAPECPECGCDLALQEGCMTCLSCGYSKCT